MQKQLFGPNRMSDVILVTGSVFRIFNADPSDQGNKTHADPDPSYQSDVIGSIS